MITEQNHIRYRTFDDLATEIISEIELQNSDRARIIRILARGFAIIYRELMPNRFVTVVKYMNNPTLRLMDYPEDMDDWCKVGVVINRAGTGTPHILTLSTNDNIYRPTNEDIVAVQCTCETTEFLDKIKAVQTGQTPVTYMVPFGEIYNGGKTVPLYGMGGGESCAGSFTDDQENERFVFSTDVGVNTPIVIQYKPNGRFKGRYTKIHDNCTECLIAFAKWKLMHNRNSSPNDRKEASINYYTEYKNLREILNASTMWEILDTLYESASLTY